MIVSSLYPSSFVRVSTRAITVQKAKLVHEQCICISFMMHNFLTVKLCLYSVCVCVYKNFSFLPPKNTHRFSDKLEKWQVLQIEIGRQTVIYKFLYFCLAELILFCSYTYETYLYTKIVHFSDLSPCMYEMSDIYAWNLRHSLPFYDIFFGYHDCLLL